MPKRSTTTSRNAGIVLLAAHFEEYIRQQIEEYAKGVVISYNNLEINFREKLVDSYWRSAASKLSRIRPKGSSNWANVAQQTLNNLLAYPVNGNTSQFDYKLISEHENNMRYETILELCKKLSISDVHTGMCRHTDFDNSIGNPHRDFRAREITRILNDFYELRNGIIHSIAQNVGVGQPTFQRWTEFFRLFATAFAQHLTRSFAAFEASI